MMTETLAKMNKVLGGNAPLNGRGLFTQKEDPPLLVIEDLAPLGFRMADRQAGLDMDHCLLAIRGLARFHASSVALCEKVSTRRYTRPARYSARVHYTVACAQRETGEALFLFLNLADSGAEAERALQLRTVQHEAASRDARLLRRGHQAAGSRGRQLARARLQVS